MSAYLLSIVGIVLISGLLSAILPEGKTATVIKGTAKLCCLLVILSPVLQFFKSLQNGEDFSDFSEQTVIQTDRSFIDYCSKERIENAETLLEEDLREKYRIDSTVTLLWDYATSKEEGSSYEGMEIKITKAEIKNTDWEMSAEQCEQIRKYIIEEYGIVEVTFDNE